MWAVKSRSSVNSCSMTLNKRILEISRSVSTSLGSALISDDRFRKSTEIENDRVRWYESRLMSTDRDVQLVGHVPLRFLVHMRRLHLCASYFSCAPPCCKSRVTLARTDPLLTLPAAEAAANWHMPYANTTDPKQAPWWPMMAHGNDLRVYFSSFSLLLLLLFFLRLFFYEIFVPFGTQDTTWCLLIYSDSQTENSRSAGREVQWRIWEASRKRSWNDVISNGMSMDHVDDRGIEKRIKMMALFWVLITLIECSLNQIKSYIQQKQFAPVRFF